MVLGFIGLGRMGLNMVIRLLSKGHGVIAYDKLQDKRDEVARKGARAVASPVEVAKSLARPRALWLMVPAGKIVDEVISLLIPHLDKGDIVIDGGNSHYKDSQRRGSVFKERGIYFLDVGASGGIEGASSGLSLTIGGEEEAFNRLIPIFETLAASGGYGHVGESGAGHFVKMAHNAIEYVMLQAYGEGFELLERSPFALDLAQVARLWNRGGVIRSWLLELSQRALAKDTRLTRLGGAVGGGETGRRALETALEREVPLPLTSMALNLRFLSRQRDSFSFRLVAALRREFGGHEVQKVENSGASKK